MTSQAEKAQVRTNFLNLADWRLRTADMYARARLLAEKDPSKAHAQFVREREAMLKTHPESPIPESARDEFFLHYFPYNPALRFLAEYVPSEQKDATLDTSGSERMPIAHIGSLILPIGGEKFTVSVFWAGQYGNGLFLPLGDTTNGTETYSGGRYVIDQPKSMMFGVDPKNNKVLVDLNYATQPSCAYSEEWICPFPPPENVLPIPLRAGEQLFKADIEKHLVFFNV